MNKKSILVYLRAPSATRTDGAEEPARVRGHMWWPDEGTVGDSGESLGGGYKSAGSWITW